MSRSKSILKGVFATEQFFEVMAVIVVVCGA